MYLQCSSSHEERTKIIQEGLLNPSADILEAMTKTEAVCTGKTLIPINFNFFSTTRNIFPSTHFHSKFFFYLDLASKLTESLEQIAAFDIEKLLSKSAILSENLLQLWQSLTKEWGAGSVSTLPKDFVQKLLTEVCFIGNCYHSPIIHIIAACHKRFYLNFLFLNFPNWFYF